MAMQIKLITFLLKIFLKSRNEQAINENFASIIIF